MANPISQIRVIKIDAVNKRIYEDYISPNDKLTAMQEAVSGVVNGEKIEGLITLAVEMEHGDSLYVHDEGLFYFKDGFTVRDVDCPYFAGNAIIAGSDDEGETQSAKIDVEEVTNMIVFKHEEDPERHAGFELRNGSLDTMDPALHLSDDGAFANLPMAEGFSLDGLCAMFNVPPRLPPFSCVVPAVCLNCSATKIPFSTLTIPLLLKLTPCSMIVERPSTP